MSMNEIASAPMVPRNDTEHKDQGHSPVGKVPSLSWKDSLPTQLLLNVICSILAKEYIMIAKQNPGVFTECRMSIPPLPIPPHKGEGIKERNKQR